MFLLSATHSWFNQVKSLLGVKKSLHGLAPRWSCHAPIVATYCPTRKPSCEGLVKNVTSTCIVKNSINRSLMEQSPWNCTSVQPAALVKNVKNMLILLWSKLWKSALSVQWMKWRTSEKEVHTLCRYSPIIQRWICSNTWSSVCITFLSYRMPTHQHSLPNNMSPSLTSHKNKSNPTLAYSLWHTQRINQKDAPGNPYQWGPAQYHTIFMGWLNANSTLWHFIISLTHIYLCLSNPVTITHLDFLFP